MKLVVNAIKWHLKGTCGSCHSRAFTNEKALSGMWAALSFQQDDASTYRTCEITNKLN